MNHEDIDNFQLKTILTLKAEQERNARLIKDNNYLNSKCADLHEEIRKLRNKDE